MNNQHKIIKKYNGKKIAILGLGIENQALVRYLLKNKIKTEITICDARSPQALGDKFIELAGRKNIRWQLGRIYNQELYKFDILFRSPGWPMFCPGIVETRLIASLRKPILSSPMKLFFDLCPAKNIIGVTGTKGKGTTSSLIFEILKSGVQTRRGASVHLGGNIGVAPFEFLSKIKKNDWVVLELSSFQLEDMEASPHIAVITNFYPEHLAPADPYNPNYHKSLKDYWNAKANIFRWQKKGDYVVLNKTQETKHKKQKFNSKIVYFGKSELPSQLIGEHNRENVAAAVEVAKIAGIKKEIIAKAVAKFKGLEHRIEFVREINGVKYYNDSFATTPEATITALKSFKEPIVLLAGGADKRASFKILAKEIKKKAKFAVLLDGQATPRLKKDLLSVGFSGVKMKLARNIKDAISAVKKNAVSGDVVLLSTACASFGMFKNYKERGRLFKEQIKTKP